jgi:uncharacterized protein YbjT (DUF2867 family)
MIAVVGASGNTGSVAAETLLSQGEKVRVIGRDAGRLARFTAQGAEAFTAEATDAEALAKAFEGATGAYVMVPPNLAAPDARAYQERVTDALAAAARKSGVPHVVALSSIGADKPAKTGPVVGLHNLEEKLNALTRLNAVYLRAGYFMENLLAQITVIRNFGFLGGPLGGDLKLPMIATRDIGAAAADLLAKRDFEGRQARELLGQRDVTYNEATTLIGKAIGKADLAYNQLPAAQLKPALLQMGMSESVAGLLLEMAESLNNGYMAALETRSARNSTPTSLETFVAEEFVPRFQGKAARA